MEELENKDQQPVAPNPDSPIQIKKTEGKGSIEASMFEKELVDQHSSQFHRWSDFRRPLEDIWSEVYRLMFSKGSDSKLPTRSKIVLPIVFQIIEAAVPKLVTVVFGQPEWYRAKNRSSQSPISNEELTAHEELLRYQLQLADYFEKFVDFFKGLFMYGTAYFLVYWKVKREWVWERSARREDVTSNGFVIAENQLKWEKKLVYKVTERRPEIEVLPIEDVYPDPYAKNEKGSEGFYITSSMSLGELEELSKGPFPVYANFDQVKALGDDADRYQQQDFKQDKRASRGVGETTKTDKSKKVDILTYWGCEDLDGDGIREEVQLVIANKSVLIRAIRNPFEHQKRPLIRGVLFPIPHEWFGMGLIEPVIGLINELITVRRQNLDMNNLILNRMWKVHTMADVDLDTLVTSPNGFVLTGDMDGIEPLVQPEIPVSPLQMSQLINNDIDNATAPKSIQGTPESGALGRTAKGAQLIISQALEKFGMGAKLIEESVVRKVLWFFKKLNEQFLDSDEVLNTFYGSIVKSRLTPEQMRADLDFELLGISETVTREATINQLFSFYNIAVQNPSVNSAAILQEIWRLMQVNVPIESIITPNPAPAATAILGNPNVSESTEQAVVDQVQQNGASAPPQIPQQ